MNVIGEPKQAALDAMTLSDACDESLDGVLADVSTLFSYNELLDYKTRSHEYLRRRGVKRSADDTAVERVVTDLVERAFGARAGDGRLHDLVDGLKDSAFDVLALARQIEEEIA